MISTTTYGAQGRLYEKKIPSLKCTQDNDRFMVSNTIAKLDYPIALITADEVALAGGVYDIENRSYYLYNGQRYWTLSPFHFTSYYSHADIWFVTSSGGLIGNNSTTSLGVRPVINLKADIKITSGDGTSISPFKIATN